MRPSALLLSLAIPFSAAFAAWPGGDAHVPPGTDFFGYANDGWLAANPIPADRAGFSIATIVTQRAEAQVRALLEEARQAPPSDDERGKIGAYYAAFMDERRIEALGGRPLARSLDRIRRAANRDALARLMGEAGAGFQGSLFALSIDPDEHDAGHQAVHLGQAGLGTLDRDFYLSSDGGAARAAYRVYVRAMLGLIGWPRSYDDAIIAFDTELAAASATAADQRDPAKSYTAINASALPAHMGRFPWEAYLKSAGIVGDRRLIIVDGNAIPRFGALFARTPLPVLKAWAAFHLVDNAAPYLSSSFKAAHFRFHGQTVQGQQAAPPRWRDGLRLVSGGGWKGIDQSRGALGDAVGRLYVARSFDPRSRERLQALVTTMKAVLKARIAASDWMSPATRAEASRKVDAASVGIGAPSTGETYDGLRIRRDDLFGDVARATAWQWTAALATLDRPVDRQRWTITPQTVNAYNYAPFNQVVFTAALLQPPAFDPAQDPALTYGGIGAIIGHELSHGFDDVGRRFDAAGGARDWWASADDARFKRKAAQLVALFSACQAAPGLPVNGTLTLGENLADIGGLELAFAAYHAALAGKTAPVIDGLTGDQRFFLGFAMLRRGQRRPDALRRDVAGDPHTPDRCRVNEDVRHIDGWYAAFGIKPTDPLYLAPADRVHIW